MKISLELNGYAEREQMTSALAESGYKVWVEEKKNFPYASTYLLCFNLKTKGEYSLQKGGE